MRSGRNDGHPRDSRTAAPGDAQDDRGWRIERPAHLHTVYRNQTQAQVNRFISGVSALATPSDTGRITIRVEEER